MSNVPLNLLNEIQTPFTVLANANISLTSTSPRNMFMPVSASVKTITLPSTGVIAGTVYRISCTNAVGYSLAINASGGTLVVRLTAPTAITEIMALQDAPTTPSHWAVLGYTQDVITASLTSTVSTASNGDLVVTMNSITSGYEILSGGIKIPATGKYIVGFSLTPTGGTIAGDLSYVHIKVNGALYATSVYLGNKIIAGNQPNVSAIYCNSFALSLVNGDYVTLNCQLSGLTGTFIAPVGTFLTAIRQ